ncbi:uncharacterized protein LOC132044867 [Lycium ferocissimum]|uniref:uncharacterized protein LOC132044867 n=1 Tax=Lycium ferocissimum TaxID=112874 RepID=UPI0028160648|nr:uncharacterized protein LOC132044867 [Lycium ferocissimum]
MAFFTTCLSFFLLITLLFSLQIHAKDNQFFNKETKVVTPNNDQEPNFMPENGNGYGVYGPDQSGQLLPPTTSNLIPNNKYLPNNFNHNGGRGVSKATNSIGPSSGGKYYSRYKRSEEHRTFRNYHGNEGDYNDKEEPKP